MATSHTVSVRISAVDDFTKRMAPIVKSLDGLARAATSIAPKVSGAFKAISASARTMGQSIADIGRQSLPRLVAMPRILGGILRSVTGLAKGFVGLAGSALGAARGIAGQVIGALRTAWGWVSGLTGKVLALAKAFAVKLAAGAAVAGAAIAGTMGKAMSMAANRLTAEASLRNLLGDAAKANAALLELKEVAKLPAVAFDEAFDAYSQLQSVKAPHATSIRVLKQMANAVAMGGGGAFEFGSVMRGVTQTFGKDRLAAEEMSIQILEKAPMLRPAIQQALGGGNTPEEWEKYRKKMGWSIAKAWDEIAKAAERLPRSAGGVRNAIDNVTDAFAEGMIALGKGLLGTNADTAIVKFADQIDDAQDGLQRLGARFRSFALGVRSQLGGLVNFNLASIVGGLENLDWSGLAQRIGRPLASAAAAVRGFGSGLLGVRKLGRETLEGLHTGARRMAVAFLELGQAARGFFAGLIANLPALSGGGLADWVQSLARLDWAGLGAKAGAGLTSAVESIRGAVSGLTTWWRENDIGAALADGAQKIMDGVKWLLDALKAVDWAAAIDGLVAGLKGAVQWVTEQVQAAVQWWRSSGIGEALATSAVRIWEALKGVDWKDVMGKLADAIEKVAPHLPSLAESIGKMAGIAVDKGGKAADWASEHPVGATAATVGALAVVPPAMRAAGTWMLKGAGAGLAGAGKWLWGGASAAGTGVAAKAIGGTRAAVNASQLMQATGMLASGGPLSAAVAAVLGGAAIGSGARWIGHQIAPESSFFNRGMVASDYADVERAADRKAARGMGMTVEQMHALQRSLQPQTVRHEVGFDSDTKSLLSRSQQQAMGRILLEAQTAGP